MDRRLPAGVLLALTALVGCGEPAPDVAIPDRPAGQHVLDQADVLDDERLLQRLVEIAGSSYDIVALTFETEQAGCGEAFRAARLFVDRWDADVALVAVARPGDFTATAPSRVRCLGVQPRGNPPELGGAVRERIAEEVVPPFAAENDWDGAFAAAVEELVGQ